MTRQSPTPASQSGLQLDELHASLTDPVLRSMDFLNEIAERNPRAISLAAGRPREDSFDIGLITEYLDTYARHLAEDRGLDRAAVHRTVLQYGPARGIVNDVIARHLAEDEDIQVAPESVVVTVGCQEAMFLVVRALRRDERDVLLAVSPTYVGLVGAARLVDMPTVPVAPGPSGIDLDDLGRAVRRERERGRRVRACYVMPDFANPTGATMDLRTRQALLRVAADEGLLLLEDNPYGFFNDGSERIPTLKSLDTDRTVVYLGSFAKTVLPGTRVGYVVADQNVAAEGGPAPLAQHLSSLKSMITVNTSPITQAIVAGKLLRHGHSLATATKADREAYRRNRMTVLHGLERAGLSPEVSWNAPAGGFFITVTVPFVVDDAELDRCAEEYGVLWTPMAHFYGERGGEHQMRVSCSGISGPELAEGVARLASYLAGRLDRGGITAV